MTEVTQPSGPGFDESGRPESRALVLAAPARAAQAGDGRPPAGFVAQLLACRAREPGYRDRRRSAPADAASSYGRTIPEHRPAVSVTL